MHRPRRGCLARSANTGLVALAAALALAGPVAAGGQELRGFGLRILSPAGWHGGVAHGVITLSTVALPDGERGFGRDLGRQLGPGDLVLALAEYEPSSAVELASCPSRSLPRLRTRLVERAARRLVPGPIFCRSGRQFTLFVRAGSGSVAAETVAEARQALASFEVEPGDHYPGQVDPAAFVPRPGWFVGSSGSTEIRAHGAFTASHASTVRYANGPYDVPPSTTVFRLGPRGMLIWLGLTRESRVPPPGHYGGVSEGPLRIRRSEIFTNWEGNSDYEHYGLYRQVVVGPRREYTVELWVWFGAAKPAPGVVAKAQRMLDSVVYPRWPAF